MLSVSVRMAMASSSRRWNPPTVPGADPTLIGHPRDPAGAETPVLRWGEPQRRSPGAVSVRRPQRAAAPVGGQPSRGRRVVPASRRTRAGGRQPWSTTTPSTSLCRRASRPDRGDGGRRPGQVAAAPRPPAPVAACRSSARSLHRPVGAMTTWPPRSERSRRRSPPDLVTATVEGSEASDAPIPGRPDGHGIAIACERARDTSSSPSPSTMIRDTATRTGRGRLSARSHPEQHRPSKSVPRR